MNAFILHTTTTALLSILLYHRCSKWLHGQIHTENEKLATLTSLYRSFWEKAYIYLNRTPSATRKEADEQMPREKTIKNIKR